MIFFCFSSEVVTQVEIFYSFELIKFLQLNFSYSNPIKCVFCSSDFIKKSELNSYEMTSFKNGLRITGNRNIFSIQQKPHDQSSSKNNSEKKCPQYNKKSIVNCQNKNEAELFH